MEPDQCTVKDPGPMPAGDWSLGDQYCLPRPDALELYVWTRDVDRLREALMTCPSVIMEPYR